jgi:hypothetical protein
MVCRNWQVCWKSGKMRGQRIRAFWRYEESVETEGVVCRRTDNFGQSEK